MARAITFGKTMMRLNPEGYFCSCAEEEDVV